MIRGCLWIKYDCKVLHRGLCVVPASGHDRFTSTFAPQALKFVRLQFSVKGTVEGLFKRKTQNAETNANDWRWKLPWKHKGKREDWVFAVGRNNSFTSSWSDLDRATARGGEGAREGARERGSKGGREGRRGGSEGTRQRAEAVGESGTRLIESSDNRIEEGAGSVVEMMWAQSQGIKTKTSSRRRERPGRRVVLQMHCETCDGEDGERFQMSLQT